MRPAAADARPTAGSDQAGLLIRPVTSADRAAVRFSLAHLGEDSWYQRFLGSRPPAPGRELDRLLRIDHWHHEVLIAWSLAPRAPVGVSEYVRLGEFDLAELAISVSDGWQRQGVGRTLAGELRRRALASGIRRFSATMLRGNRGARSLARELGRISSSTGDGQLVTLVVEL